MNLKCPHIVLAPDETITKLEMMIPRIKIPAKETAFKCYAFNIPIDREYNLVASEPMLDSPLLHHITVYGCWDHSKYSLEASYSSQKVAPLELHCYSWPRCGSLTLMLLLKDPH